MFHCIYHNKVSHCSDNGQFVTGVRGPGSGGPFEGRAEGLAADAAAGKRRTVFLLCFYTDTELTIPP